MDETLRQVGELLLGSIPTIVFMVLLYGIYTALVHKPLVKVLAERRSKTEGAVEKARADIAAAEARTAEYEKCLREARVAVGILAIVAVGLPLVTMCVLWLQPFSRAAQKFTRCFLQSCSTSEQLTESIETRT